MMEPNDLVTEDHVKTALKSDKGEDAQLISWEIEDFIKKGDNIACFVTSVKIKFSKEGSEQDTCYIVKTNPCRNIEVYDGISRHLFSKEVGFYMDLVPELINILHVAGQQQPLRIPKCFHTDMEKAKEIIFLEDLRPRGFKMLERHKGMDFAHTTLVLKELARLHASSYLLQKINLDEDLTVKNPFLKLDLATSEGKVREFFSNFLTLSIETTIEMLKRDGGHEKAIDWLSKYKLSFIELLEKMVQRTPPFDVICHGDCWNNNALFRYDDEGNPVEVMLLDFQLNRYASLTTDLNSLLFTSLNGDVRQPNTETFLENYFESFKEIVEAGGKSMSFTFQQLRQEYRNKHPLGLQRAMILIPFMMKEESDIPHPEEVFAKKTKGEEENMKRKSIDLNEKNPLFRPRFMAFINEMNEAGVFD